MQKKASEKKRRAVRIAKICAGAFGLFLIVGALAVSIYLNTMLDLVHYVPALGDNSPAASGGDVVPMGTPGEDLTTASDSPKEQVSSIEDQLKKNLE
ncbi:MAG: hypothetical protein FWC62_08445, partial [Firmicutes bacterium]|nr:hypothetical protein [Bacillota bacterium]